MSQPKTESIKFYYNGFKINGERKLNKCSYQLRDGSVSISTYGYFTDLPKDLFAVRNNTDIMTDYFDSDRAEVTSDHPLYKYIRAAALNAEIRSTERSITYNEKRAAQADISMKEFYNNAAEQARNHLANYKAELEALGNVGQPTAADIEVVAAFNTAAETARIQAEHDAEIAEREEKLARQHEETEYITGLMGKYPVREGEPYVEIGYSENGTISSLRAAHAERVQKPTYNGGYIEDFGPLVLSPLAANYALAYLDGRYNDIGCDKTDFAFIYTDENGEEQRYTGRYDIGREHKNLLEHMREHDDDENAAEMANVFERCLLAEKGFDNITPFPVVDFNIPSSGSEVDEIKNKSPEQRYKDYVDIVSNTPDDIVLFANGDFFELYNDDAKIAANVLGIELTTRSFTTDDSIVLCGIPAHNLEQSVEKLRTVKGVTVVTVTESGTYATYSLNARDDKVAFNEAKVKVSEEEVNNLIWELTTTYDRNRADEIIKLLRNTEYADERTEEIIQEAETKLARLPEEIEHIKQLLNQYPVRDNNTYIEVFKSGHSAISAVLDENLEQSGHFQLSPLAAELMFSYIDSRSEEISDYSYKVDFALVTVNSNGETQRKNADYFTARNHPSLGNRLHFYGGEETYDLYNKVLIEDEVFYKVLPFALPNSDFLSEDILEIIADDILPLDEETARQMFESDFEVFFLSDDDDVVTVTDIDEIAEYAAEDSVFFVGVEDWRRYAKTNGIDGITVLSGEKAPEPDKDLAYFEDLLSKTTEQVFSSKEEWSSFLRFQGKFYKYNFRDRLLIYAQSPNATACAEAEIWRERMGRTVTNDENAIMLFPQAMDGNKMRFVFDVADTEGRPFPAVWQYTEQAKDTVISALQSDNVPQADTLVSSTSISAENLLDERLDNLSDLDYNSFKELNSYRQFMIYSVATIVSARCGVETEPYSPEMPEFDNEDVRLKVGTVISETSASILRTIEKSVREYTKTERSKQNETEIHREEVQPGKRPVVLQEWELLDTDDSNERDKRQSPTGSLRESEVSISRGEPTVDIRGEVDKRDAVPSLQGSGTAGERPVRQADERDAEGRGHNRGAEARRPDEMGAADEQLSSSDRRDNPRRTDISAITEYEEGNGQFSLFMTSENQNTVVIKAESVQTPSAFSVPQKVVDLFLQFGGNTTNHRKIIAAEFSKGKSVEENAAFLSELYHGGNGLTIDGKLYSTWYDEDGILFARGSFARYVDNAELLPWEQAAERTTEMLDNGTFATVDELADALHYERLQLAQKLWYIKHDLTDEAKEAGYLSALDIEKFNDFPNETAELANKLADLEFVSMLAPQIQALYTDTLDGAELLRFNYHHLGAAYKGTKELLLPRREFVSSITALPEIQPFITEDEIDKSFTRGSGYEGGTKRIIEFFGAEHTQAEREKFLSREYGIGGRSHALSRSDNSMEEHDGKGVTLKKGDCAEVKLTWSQVANRIDTLIKTDRYIELKTLTVEAVEAEIKAQQAEQTNELVRTADVPTISELDLPDLTVLPEDMHNYGYTWDGMLPLSENMARRLFEGENLEVFCLYNDDTETAITDVDEIEEHAGYNGVFGIRAEVWQEYREKQIAERAAKRNIASSGTEVAESEPQRDYTFEYQLLSRLQSDCNYFLGNGGRNGTKLWAGNVNDQIAKMRELYNLLPEKPDWLTAEQIDDYEWKMQPRYQVVVYHSTENGFDMREDYQSFKEALTRAKAYVDGTAEADGFKYEGAAIFDDLTQQYVYTYGSIEIDNEPAPQTDRDIAAVYYVPAFDNSYEQRIEIEKYPNGTYGIHYDVDLSTGFSPAGQGGFRTFYEAVEELRRYRPNARKLEIPVRAQEQEINLPSSGREVDENVFGNFRITDNNLGVGGAKAKFRANIEAIKQLKELERIGAEAIPEQQERMAKYVGWGGLADAFDPRKENWQTEYNELKELLTDEEYKAAKASTLTSFYTNPDIIRAIYKVLGNMGFEQGKILEPAMGIGNFFGCLPENMQGSELHGVELDDISGRIAKKLYPKADITIGGFETTNKKDFYDIAIGNVPFGDISVNDPEYNKLGFPIHDYFFAKTLDQVRPGGIIAFVTSRYTLDKKSPEARKYIAERAELLGAIRLPNNAFKANAGTEVVSDIIFLQKRDRPIVIEPDWVHLDHNLDDFAINSYFVENPEMVLGRESSTTTQYGRTDYTVEPFGDLPLDRQLNYAIQNISGYYKPAATVGRNLSSSGQEVEAENSIPADPNVRDNSYTLVDGQVYFRDGAKMNKSEKPPRMQTRIAGLIGLRDQTRKLIDMQLSDYTTDEQIAVEQAELDRLYDEFVRKNGLVNDHANSLAFRDDESYPLLCSLEQFDKDDNYIGKSAIFTKRTILAKKTITHTDTAAEALAVSLSEKGEVDLDYISRLTGKDRDTVIKDLKGAIYKRPEDEVYVTADEYLSGNVRRKLDMAEYAAMHEEGYEDNIAALNEVMPAWLSADQIKVRLGATWIDPKYVEQFIHETLGANNENVRKYVRVAYEPTTARWAVIGKTSFLLTTEHTLTYGTKRKPALDLIEDALNLKITEVIDHHVDDLGRDKAEKNVVETVLAQEKQDKLKKKFSEWIWQDPERREELEQIYNEQFNSTVPRRYNGDHLTFPGMTPDIELKDYQKNAVARRLYGDNELLGHAVGAGKTFSMIATAQKMKQLGLCNKSIFVVPNHLTKQWARDYLRLYPNANILVAGDEDMSPAKRKKFCARIATGDYDAIIIKQSQFRKIPMSLERQEQDVKRQIDELENALLGLDSSDSVQNFSIKQIEKSKANLKTTLKALQMSISKNQDDMLTFEQLGVDNLFVDEAHHYKNLYFYTKMNRVAGLSTKEVATTADMKQKCDYINEITGSKGITFATATYIMNSVSEMYTMQRYLQPDRLKELGWYMFDSWVGQFGEVTIEEELAPEGNGYRERQRLSRFANMPELSKVFGEVLDSVRSEELDIPRPELDLFVDVAEATEDQKAIIQQLGERADAVRGGAVNPSEDNMLKITTDGRKTGLDVRLIDPSLPDNPNSKVNQCVRSVFDFYVKYNDDKLTQIIFCDLGTPGKGKPINMVVNDEGVAVPAEFQNIYDDIKKKLIALGVPANEIAFVQDCNTPDQKEALFKKVRTGEVRVLMGSTETLGEGTNVQDKLIALHDLDCPWRPSDLVQRLGRGLRYGNLNKMLFVRRYVSNGTFDSYLWQMLEIKQRFIDQATLPSNTLREFEEPSTESISYAQTKALCAGDPNIQRKMELEVSVSKLKLKLSEHMRLQNQIYNDIHSRYPEKIRETTADIELLKKDLAVLAAHPLPEKGFVGLTAGGKLYDKPGIAGMVLLSAYMGETGKITAEYRGFTLTAERMNLTLSAGNISHNVDLFTITTGHGVMGRVDGVLDDLAPTLEHRKERLTQLEADLVRLKGEYGKPFEHMDELNLTEKELKEVNIMLDSSATKTDIMSFAKNAYHLIKKAIPDYLPSSLTEQQCIDNFADKILSGNIESVCYPLERVRKNGEKDDREEARNMIDAYKSKASEWAIESNKTAERSAPAMSGNRYSPEI